MKYSKCLALALLITSVAHLPLAAQVNPAYEVATWRDFKTAAVSYTMDDNNLNQLAVAIPLFNQFNFKTTLFTVTNWNPNWAGLRTAAANGHEIASHTASHTSLNTLTVAQQTLELQQSQAAIRANVPGAKCETVAYPNCNIGDLNALGTYYLAGRRCSDIQNPSSPSDYFYLNSIITGAVGWVQTAASLNNQVDLARASRGWCIFTIHGIDNDGGYSPTQSSELAGHLAYVQRNSSDFWVATFSDAVKYSKERNAASLTETAISIDSLRLVVADNLPDAVYDLPITVRRQLPATWTNARVWAGNNLVASTITTVGASQYITFDAVPDQGPLHLAKSIATPTSTRNSAAAIQVKSWPNPFADKATVEVPGKFSFTVYSLDGKLLETGSGVNSAKLGGALSSGTYIIKVSQGDKVTSTTIIKK